MPEGTEIRMYGSTEVLTYAAWKIRELSSHLDNDANLAKPLKDCALNISKHSTRYSEYEYGVLPHSSTEVSIRTYVLFQLLKYFRIGHRDDSRAGVGKAEYVIVCQVRGTEPRT